MKLANLLKKNENLEIDFLTADHEDWGYYYKRGYKNLKDVRDYLHQISFRKMRLNLYKKWNLDKDNLLLNNFIRYKNLNSKSLDHYAVQREYNLINELVGKIFLNKKLFKNTNFFRKAFYYLLKIFCYPLIPLTNKKSRYLTNEIRLFVHKILYYWSKLILFIFRYLPKTFNLIIWKKKFEHLHVIAYMNKDNGFKNISKLALKYFITYYYLLKKINPDVVLIYNGSWATNTTLAAACKKLDICHYFTDYSGFVGYALFDQTAIWYEGDINRKELPDWSEERELELNDKINTYLKVWSRGIASAAEDDKIIDTPLPEKKFIFVPLQMMSDTNNIKFSPLLEDNLQLVELVVKYTPKEYDIIVKRHPWDMIWADPLYWKCLIKIREIADEHDNVLLYHYADSQVLLKHCEALITANSTLSLENLFEARAPMIILGDNFVRGWGFTYDVNNLEEFQYKLRETLEKKVTPDMITKMKQFLHLYFHQVLIKGQLEINFEIHDKQGNLIKKVHLPSEPKGIAERLQNEFIQIQERKTKGLKKRLPDIKKYRCLIDRSKIPNYIGVILDYKP